MSIQGLILIQLWVFGLGLVIGSFLNVCTHRIPEGISIVWPASKCAYCSKRIVWYDNIPVLSYLFLRGKCRHCQRKISAQYPIVEFLTGTVFLLLFRSVLMVSSGTTCVYVFFIVFCCLLIVGSFVDLRLHIIPNEITYTGLILAPIASILCVGLPRLIFKKGNVIPYGPFLSLAAFVCLLFKDFSIKNIDHYLNICLSIFQLL